MPMEMPWGNLLVKLPYIILWVWGIVSGMWLSKLLSVKEKCCSQCDAWPSVKAMVGDARG